MKSLLISRSGIIVVAIALLIAIAGHNGFLENASSGLYDKLRGLGDPPTAGVTVVALDEASLAALDEYPVRDETHVRVLDNLLNAGVKAVGLVGLHSLIEGGNAEQGGLAYPAVQGTQLAEAIDRLRKQSSIVSSIPFVDRSSSDPATKLPGYIIQNSLPGISGSRVVAARPVINLPETTSGPAASFASILVDSDNGRTVRSVPLFVEANGLLIPSIALHLYIRSQGERLADLKVGDSGDLTLAGREIVSDIKLQTWPYLHDTGNETEPAFDMVSYHDVLHGAVSRQELNGKIVLLGVTARGLVPAVRTPVHESYSPVMLAASTLASMIDDKVVARPSWVIVLSYLFLILVAGLLLWLLAKETRVRLLVASGVLVFLFIAQALMLSLASTWVDMFPPILLLLVGLAATGLMQGGGATTEKATGMSGEVHRRVGLASQKRGELDPAFESFRKCPLDNSMMVLLFYLAQDFENEGRYDRAVAVYQYMESFNPHFKDLQDRLEKSRMMEDTVMIDEKKITPAVSTEITSVESEDDKPEDSDGQQYLGRYRVEHEIGKGAMGMVYQGSDPKINRTVAIKTLNLKREFDEDEQENVLGRFFHEAEAAGRLHHPHIVTIYDAGEHNELAYIAMEYLTGSDLRVYTKKGTLLSPLTVVKIGMKLAGALAYAHSRDIIHRDIKAANVMYDPSTGQLKITDFGIARLTDSRRTKTGMVLGTPSSMSPEQLRGKKLDGRTDLYSLGVLMFQLLTGRLPYKAESLTQLMYKITNEPTPDLFALRPDLEENGLCIKEVIEKLLQKDADDRYQDGKKLARDLLACAKKMTGKK